METLQSTIFIEFDVNTKKITFLRGDNIIDYDSNATSVYVRVKYKNLNGNTVYLTPSELEDYKFSLYTIKPATNNINVITGEVTDELKENVYGGVVKFEIPRVCTNRLGIVKCEIHINQGNKIIASSIFVLDVRQSLVTEFNDALLEDEDFPVLKQLILEVQKVNNIDDNNRSKITTYSSDKIENIREDLSSQIKEKANEVDLNIERERINNIVKNTGTSVNDLELQDIRVSYDGKTYSSAGESVRSQVKEAMSSIYDLKPSLNIFDNSQPFIEGKSISNWDVGSTTYNDLYNTERWTSYIIPIKPNTRYIFLKNDGTNQGSIQAYGIYDKTGKSLYYGTGGVTEMQENQAFLRFSANANDAKAVVNIQPYDADKGLEGYTIQEFGFIKNDKFALEEDVNNFKEEVNNFKEEVNNFKEDVNNFKEDVNNFKEDVNNKLTNELKKPVIVFMFDSSYDNNTCGILKKYGFNGTYFLGNSKTNFDSLKEGIKKLVFEGHDIGIYTGNGTRPTTYVGDDSDEWYNYIKKAVDNLKEIGIYNPTAYGCAKNQGSTKIYEFAKQLGFKYVRCNYKVVNGETWESEGTVFEDWKNNTPNNLNLCPYNMPEKTFEQIKTNIDYAIANNKILPLFTHGAPTVGDSINVSYEIFEQVCSYVKDKVELGEIEVLTARQLWNKYNEQEGRWRDYISVLSSIISKY